MTQSNMQIANQTFPLVRAAITAALQAGASQSSGDTAPATTYPGQPWFDTANSKLKMRNAANNAWLTLATIDVANDRWQLHTDVLNLLSTAGLTVKSSTGTTLLTLSNAGVLDALSIKLNGVLLGALATKSYVPGSWELIEAQSGSLATPGLVFTGFDASKYDDYKFVFQGLQAYNNFSAVFGWLSIDGGSTWLTTGYSGIFDSYRYGDTAPTLTSNGSKILLTAAAAPSQDGGMNGELLLVSPGRAALTGDYRHFHFTTTAGDGSGNVTVTKGGGLIQQDVPINAIQFNNVVSGAFGPKAGIIAMYGRRKA